MLKIFHPYSTTLYSSAKSNNEAEPRNHQSNSVAPELSEEDKKLVETLQKHQSSAAKLSISEEIKTLVQYSNGFGVLSTNSVKYSGYPTGSVVGFSIDKSGFPFFVFSTMSAHTSEINKDTRSSLTIMANDFKGAAEGRAVLIGDVTKLPDDKKEEYRLNYLSRHKDAFWIDFGY
jgi:hypothetical protein